MEKTFEEMEKSQEQNQGKVTNEAVAKAQANIEQRKLEREAAEVERCLERAERNTSDAAKEGRMASKRRNILKKYSEGIAEALEILKTDANVAAYNDKIAALDKEKCDSIDKATQEIWGSESWRH